MPQDKPRGLFALPLALLTVAGMASIALSGASTSGKWTSKYDVGARWNHISVHLLLTRGYDGHHSQILWYNSHPENDLPGDSLRGGVWGWNPAIGTHEANCDSYPANSFTALTHGQPTNNIFCTGHTVLSDGRVLIVGGSENGAEVGERRSVIFNPSSRTFTNQDDMPESRWYPTVTTLPNGKALVTSGSTFAHEWIFGGQSVPDGSTVYSDSLRLLGDTEIGQWDLEIRDSTAYGTGDWPGAQVGHSAVFNGHNSEMTVFGGATSSGTNVTNNVYFIYRHPDKDDGAHYGATRVAQSSSIQPSARCWHSAVVPDDSTMILFGGRDLFTAKNDVYELAQSGTGTWVWNKPTTTGTGPSLRQGHSAVWDPENSCMLVYGGIGRTSLTDTPLAADSLFMLTRGSTWTWSLAPVDADPTYGTPGPRYGHSMVIDENERYGGATGAPDTLHARRALLFGGKGSGGLLNDLWVLWIPEAGSGAHYIWQRVPAPSGTQPSPRMRFAMYDDVLKDRLVVSGGTVGDSATASTWSLALDHIAASNDNSWVGLANFPYGRVTGHTASFGAINWNFGQDVFDPSTGNWTAQGSRKRQDWYPFGFVAPQTDSIRVFYAGPDTQSYYYNLSASTPYWRPFPAHSTPTFRGGSAVMYLPGKVMRCGSRDTDGQLVPATGATQTIDLLASPAPSDWAPTDSMSARVNHNLVILPTGMVLAIGGTTTIQNGENIGPVFRPQMWRPATASWTSMTGVDTLAADSTIRGYHSAAMLLPDGRILSISGNPTHDDDRSQGNLDAVRATVYCPPYLFNSSGVLKSRPVISESTPNTDYNTDFTLCLGSGSGPSVGSVCLIRPAATTHAFNMDQRYIPLSFQGQCRNSQLTITAPANSSIAPPGDYMLFVVSADSMPSIAQWIGIGTPSDISPECLNCGGFGNGLIAGGDGGSGDLVTTTRGAVAAQAVATSVAAEIAPPENALLNEPTGERLYRLRTDPARQAEAVVRIIQEEGGQTSLDAASLSVVDFAAGSEVHAAGSHVIVGVASSIANVSSTKGLTANLTSDVAGATPWISTAGDTLSVELGDSQAEGSTAGGSQTLLVTARRGARDAFGGAPSPDLSVLGKTASGRDTVLATAEPRWGFDEIAVENIPAHTRIVAGLGTQIQRIAWIAKADSVTSGTPLTLARLFDGGKAVSTGPLQSADGTTMTVAANDTVSLHWTLPPPTASGLERAYFLRASSATVSTDVGTSLANKAGQATQTFIFALSAARPNPFVGETTIDFSLAHPGQASLRLYNVAGRLIRTLVKGPQLAGPASIVWDGRDDHGVMVGGGVYFARLESGTKHSNRKMIFLGR